MDSPVFEVQSDSVAALNAFNEFVHDHLNMQTSLKKQELLGNVKAFFSSHSSLWADLFHKALSCILFEETRNNWVFQKWLYTTLVILMKHQSEGVVQRVVVSMLNEHEEN